MQAEPPGIVITFRQKSPAAHVPSHAGALPPEHGG